MMGSEEGIADVGDELPVHRVEVDSFLIGKFPVTQREWRAVIGTNPSHFKGDDLPVESVSWNDAQEYLHKLSQITGKRFRLPTEAEWEYACRAGSMTKYCFGDNKSQLDEYAWYDNNSEEKTHPVGQKKPNAWGLYDMHGHVGEWCQDWYDENYYAKSPLKNQKGPSSGIALVVRGGSWQYYAYWACSPARLYCRPNYRVSTLGFRCVQEP